MALAALALPLGYALGGPRAPPAPTRSAVTKMQVQVEKAKNAISEASARQLGNDAFLNEDLMGRAIKGPGVKSKSKLKVAVVGAGLAGMVASMDLVDAGHDVELFELRPFVGGKVSSWQDNDGNHIEMGLHVFFGCYYNLFGIMKRTGSFDKSARPAPPQLTRARALALALPLVLTLSTRTL